jgi:dihydrofolate reductase
MRKIVVFDRVTADGYFSTPEGGLDWTVPDAEIDRLGGEAAPGPGNMLLFGRRTYQMFESFWPHVLKDSPEAPDPHVPGRQSAAMRNMAVWIHEATKIVFSKSLETVTWNNSRLLRDIEPAGIRTLKEEAGGPDIMIFGSGEVVSRLTALGLIDEYQLIVSPLLLGSGKPLVSGVTSRVPLELLEVNRYDSGNVMLRYARRQAGRRPATITNSPGTA